MTEQEKSKQTTDKSLKVIRRSSSKQYAIFVAIFCLGVTVFLTSALWMPSLIPQDIGTISAIGDVQNLEDGCALTLRSWKYDRAKSTMEMCVDVSASDETASSYVVMGRSTYQNELAIVSTKNKGCFEKILFITMENVPDISDKIGVFISVSEQSEQSALFTCVPNSAENAEILEKTAIDYHVEAIDERIKTLTEEIQNRRDVIAKAQEDFAKINDEIDELESKKEYQTKDEVLETEQKQGALRDQQTQLLNTVSITQDEITDINDTLAVMKKRREAVLTGRL